MRKYEKQIQELMKAKRRYQFKVKYASVGFEPIPEDSPLRKFVVEDRLLYEEWEDKVSIVEFGSLNELDEFIGMVKGWGVVIDGGIPPTEADLRILTIYDDYLE